LVWSLEAIYKTEKKTDAETYFLDGHDDPPFFERVEPFEFILIYQDCEWTDFVGNTEIPRVCRDMFYVLCLERGGGVAERRGLTSEPLCHILSVVVVLYSYQRALE
jgi:hypothetical protein